MISGWNVYDYEDTGDNKSFFFPNYFRRVAWICYEKIHVWPGNEGYRHRYDHQDRPRSYHVCEYSSKDYQYLNKYVFEKTRDDQLRVDIMLLKYVMN